MPEPVYYNLAVQEMLNFLKKWQIPFELLNVQEADGSISAAGIIFKGCCWKDGKLVEYESSLQNDN
jgi:hypothetical protein